MRFWHFTFSHWHSTFSPIEGYCCKFKYKLLGNGMSMAIYAWSARITFLLKKKKLIENWEIKRKGKKARRKLHFIWENDIRTPKIDGGTPKNKGNGFAITLFLECFNQFLECFLGK